ncbi:MAG: type 4a pilus biogenesis protein PilO [Planctomycetia bacterium]|nr:type 4a pilus biogenesis protein PilO [Planctomycetia bacterium]
MKNATEKKTWLGGWVLTAALLALALAYYFLSYRPAGRKIAAMKADLAMIQQTLADAAVLPAHIGRVSAELKETGQFVQEWASASRRDELPAVLGRITAALAEAGVRTVQFTPEPAVEHAVIEKVPLTVSVEGTLEQLADVLSKLEALPTTVWIEELKVLRSREDGETLACELKLAIFADKSNVSD